MKRFAFLLFGLILATTCTFAQNLEVTLGGGLASHYSRNTSPVGAFKLGVAYEEELSLSWSLAPQLSFYAKGWKGPNEDYETLVTVEDDSGILHEETKAGVIGHSAPAYYVTLSCPVRRYLRMPSENYFFMQAGPFLAIGVGGKQETKGDPNGMTTGEYYYDRKVFSSATGNTRFDAGFTAGVGFQFASGLQIGLEGDFGLVKLASTQSRNVSGLVTLSYHLPLEF